MDDNARQFFHRLVTTPGVSGFEQPVQRVVREYSSSFVQSAETDLHGNLILATNPKSETRIMLAGHADQIGLIISYIDEDGYLYTQPVGGWDPQQLVGQQMVVWSRRGPVSGVIARRAIHLLDEAERNKVVQLKSLWIDIGASNRQQAESLVEIGDSVTLRLETVELANGLITGPAMDNRTGVWVVVEALRRAAAMGLKTAVFSASTVQEEIGLRGAQTAAYSINPHIGIAVDVTHATDSPESDRKQQGHVKLGAGPVIVRGPNMNPLVCDRLEQLAREHHLPTQRVALGRAASNDSNVMQISRGGVATAVVAIPNRYMHSAVEMVSLTDLDHAAELIARFCASVSDHREFLPQ